MFTLRAVGLTLRPQQEIFTPPSPKIVSEYAVQYDASAHGESGNVQSTYSPFFWPLTRRCLLPLDFVAVM